MNTFYEIITAIFDPLHATWESDRTHRMLAGLLIAIFLAMLLGIELNRQGLLPPATGAMLGTNHFKAVNMAFTLVLILEVISLIFTLPCSVTKAVGKQFEILALILLRNSFKELVNLPEPVTIEGHADSILRIGSDGLGALCIFALLGIYYSIQRTAKPAIRSGASLYAFTAAKKAVALFLLAVFLCMGAYNVVLPLAGHNQYEFFPAFYTLLIFSDILIVLIAQRHLPQFRSMFRNSAFALVTLIIRLALSAPPYYNAALGAAAAGYAVLLSLLYNRYFAPKDA